MFEFDRKVVQYFFGCSTIIKEVKVGLTSLFLRRMELSLFSRWPIDSFHDLRNFLLRKIEKLNSWSNDNIFWKRSILWEIEFLNLEFFLFFKENFHKKSLTHLKDIY